MDPKEAFDAVKDLTMNALYLCVGVYTLVGGFLTSAKKELDGKKTLLGSLALIGMSVLVGCFVLMYLTGAKVRGDFNANDLAVRLLSASQILLAAGGFIAFFAFLCKNLSK